MPVLLKRSAAYSALLLTGVNLVSQLIAFFYRIALSRLIGAEGMGLFQLVFPVNALMMAICVSGIAVAVNRLSAEILAKAHPGNISSLLHSAINLFLSFLAPVAIIIVLFSDFISCSFLGDARTQLGLILLIPCVLLTGLENIQKNFFYGIKNVIPPAISEIVEQLVRTGSVLALLILFQPKYEEDTVGLIVCGMVICEVVSALLLRILYQRDTVHCSNIIPLTPKSRRQISKSLLSIAVPVGFTAVLGTLIGSIGAIIIPGRLAVSGLTHSEALADYGILFGMTMQLLGLPNVFLNSLSLVMIPRLAESAASGHELLLQTRIQKTMTTASVFIFGIMPVLAVSGAGITQFLFQEPKAGVDFPLLTIGAALGCFQLITTNLLSAIGRQGRGAVFVLLGDLLQLLLTYFLVANPTLRLHGFAIATVLGTACTVILNLISLIRRTGPIFQLYDAILLPVISGIFAMIGASLLIATPIFFSETVRYFLAIPVGLVIYFSLLACGRYLKKRVT